MANEEDPDRTRDHTLMEILKESDRLKKESEELVKRAQELSEKTKRYERGETEK